MPTYNIQGWIWAGMGSPVTLLPITVSDDDPELSPYFTDDFTETVAIAGTTYTNPRGGTYQLTFDDAGGTSYTEDFLLWSTGSNFIFAPLPGSNFDTGSEVTALGGWQDWTSGFDWVDVACFARDTLIDTCDGQRPIQDIRAGDRIMTEDRALQTVQWAGYSRIIFKHLSSENAHRLRPIRIMANSLGNGFPERDLLVSRQHRILVRSRIAERMFGRSEVLVPAIKLTELPGIYIDETCAQVDYFHLLFDQHEIIFAEGAPSESLFTGPEALNAIGSEAREEVLSLFPDLASLECEQTPVRPIPAGNRLKKLITRHLKNGKPLFSEKALQPLPA